LRRIEFISLGSSQIVRKVTQGVAEQILKQKPLESRKVKAPSDHIWYNKLTFAGQFNAPAKRAIRTQWQITETFRPVRSLVMPIFKVFN
jgi:hypothetical protein